MARKIKIGFLTERMLLGFGVDLVVHQTAKQLLKQGFEVAVFCLRADKTYRNKDYPVIEIKARLAKNPEKNQRQLKKILKRLDKEEIDLWLVESYPFYLATKVMTKPVIVVDHGVSSTEGFSLWKKAGFSYIHYLNQQHYFPRAQKIICISRFIRSLTPKNLRKKQTIIYNGADHYKEPGAGARENFRQKWGLKEEEIVLLYIGRLNHEAQPYKGTKELVATYKKLKKEFKEVRLVMAGFGSGKDRRTLEKAGVTTLVSKKPEEIARAFAAADIYVSASKWEGFNLPLVEAESFGLPAVVYDVGAHREVLGQKAGFLVKDRAQFLEKLRRLVKSEKKRREMGAAGKKNARRFRWQRVGKKYKKLILEELGKAREEENRICKGYKKSWVDLIIVNYNGKKHLKKLLRSLKKQTYKKFQVTVMDNGSQDGSAEYLKRKHPEVNLVELKENLFFSKANNLAVRKTNGEYLLFLNNDTILEEDALEQMLKTLKARGKYLVAAVAPKILLSKRQKAVAGRVRFKAPGRIIDAVGTVIDKNSSPFNRGHGQLDFGQYDHGEEVFGACFAAALVQRLYFEKTVGLLDDSYFGYFEDIDWSMRARLLGYKIFSAPKAVVYHDHSATSKKKGQEWKNYLIYKNYAKTVIKNLEFKNVLRIIGRLKLETAARTVKTEDERRLPVLAVIKLWGSVFMALPGLLYKRYRIQKTRCLKDEELFKFSRNERVKPEI